MNLGQFFTRQVRDTVSPSVIRKVIPPKKTAVLKSRIFQYGAIRRTYMKRARFTDSQVIAILKEAESGVSVPTLCSKHSMSDATLADFSE